MFFVIIYKLGAAIKKNSFAKTLLALSASWLSPCFSFHSEHVSHELSESARILWRLRRMCMDQSGSRYRFMETTTSIWFQWVVGVTMARNNWDVNIRLELGKGAPAPTVKLLETPVSGKRLRTESIKGQHAWVSTCCERCVHHAELFGLPTDDCQSSESSKVGL